MCLNLLTTTYNLKQKFVISQQFLQNLLGELSFPSQKLTPTKAPVEIIVGKKTYDIKDLVIIENDKQDNIDFTGFLKNLGTTVSASFVNKKQIKIKKDEEEPKVMLKKINKLTDAQMKISYVFNYDLRTRYEKILKDLGIINPTPLEEELVVSALNKQLECTICKKVYSSETRFKTHISKCGKQMYKQVESNSNHFICTICDQIFTEIESLKSHIQTIHKYKGITCNICGLSFPNRKRYSYHKFTRHCEKNYICDVCGKGFYITNLLKNHMKRHETEKATACICSVCGKSFNYKGALYYHMKMHNNIRNYNCDYCDRKFYTIMSKKRHLRTHTGERPYQCKLCRKRFFSTGELKKHQFVHTGVSSYICAFCNKHFSSKFNLNLHLTFYSGDYICKICDKSFISSDIVKFHFKRKHKNIEISWDNDEEIKKVIQE